MSTEQIIRKIEVYTLIFLLVFFAYKVNKEPVLYMELPEEFQAIQAGDTLIQYNTRDGVAIEFCNDYNRNHGQMIVVKY